MLNQKKERFHTTAEMDLNPVKCGTRVSFLKLWAITDRDLKKNKLKKNYVNANLLF